MQPTPPSPGTGLASGGWTLLAAAAASCCLHGGLYAALLRQERPTRPPPVTQIVMEVVSRAPPPPPPPPPPPAATPQAKPVSRPKLAPVVRPSVPAPPPPPAAAPAQAAPPPVHIGLSLSSTVQGGSFAAPVGGTLAGQIPEQAAAPAAGPKTARPANFVHSDAVAEAPEVDAEPDLRAYYPEAARKDGLEAQIRLRLTIDSLGVVIEARVVQGAGHGFDEAAVRAALEKLHFKPARSGDGAVATEITYTFTFLVD